jgi:TRAP-type C4-dicarboxylate transport system permease large subunit
MGLWVRILAKPNQPPRNKFRLKWGRRIKCSNSVISKLSSNVFLMSGMLGSSALKNEVCYFVIFWTIFIWWFLISPLTVMDIHQKAHIWSAFESYGIDSSSVMLTLVLL